MCLAVPGQIKVMLDKNNAIADFMGIEKKIALDLLTDVKAGDCVIVHAGFAISKLNEKEFLYAIGCFRQISELSGSI